jgi:hypothetical protein
MKFLMCGAIAACAAASMVPLGAQQSGISVDKDDVVIRGCVTRAERFTPVERMPLVWSKNDILVAVQDSGRRSSENPAGRLLYWLDDKDLTDNVGKMVEIKGELEDVKKGEVEVDRHDDYTTVELKFAGKTEKARIPTPWFSAARDEKDKEYQVAVQRVDVEDVRVIGSCDR